MHYFDDCETVENVLGQLAGAASMCWHPPPTGVFDTERAIEFVNAAADRLRALTQTSPV